MNLRYVFLGAMLFCSAAAWSQPNYDVKQIPDSLLTDANVVVREYTTIYKRTSVERYSRSVHIVVTVMNKRGDNAANLSVLYDRDSRVSQISGKLYHANGSLQGKLKKKEIRDVAYNNSFTLLSDNRLKRFSPTVNKYPYTMEYNYTVDYTGVVGFGTWMPQLGYNTSVQQAKLVFETPTMRPLLYKELNCNFKSFFTLIDGAKRYQWDAGPLKAIDHSFGAPYALDLFPAVMLDPQHLNYEGTTAQLTSWKTYGAWSYGLIQGMDSLPDETIARIKALTDTIATTREKAKAIYQYMQGRTRYVNIAFGIGGFKPIAASLVDAKGYGDCKALSNYTKALLNCVGITAYYSEIGNGNQCIKYPDYASASQTNHIVLCLPLDGDTAWMECTSQIIPFGFLGSGSQGRYALLIKPEGGELARTPSFGANENTRNSNINISMDNSGNARFQLHSEYNNGLYSSLFGLIYSSNKEQRDALLRWFSDKALTLGAFSISEANTAQPQGQLQVEGSLASLASKTGKRMFVPLHFLHNNWFPAEIPTNRQLPLYEETAYSYNDTLTITLPAGYRVEHLQEGMEQECFYGTCSYQVSLDQRDLKVVRHISIEQGTYKPEQFAEINTFLTAIDEFESRKIVIVAE